MARKAFFSFHYERDVWRSGQVRNCNLLPSEDQYGFIDAADWESIRRQGEAAIERWINNQLQDTSVTVVLIGSETANRPWVRYEILKSWNRGNGLVGILMHNIKDEKRQIDARGANPFDRFKLPDGILLSSICRTYDWVADDGRNNLGKWIEEAWEIRAKYGKADTLVAISDIERSANVSSVRTASVSAGFAPRAPWSPQHAGE
jgi:hypothetical protein